MLEPVLSLEQTFVRPFVFAESAERFLVLSSILESVVSGAMSNQPDINLGSSSSNQEQLSSKGNLRWENAFGRQVVYWNYGHTEVLTCSAVRLQEAPICYSLLFFIA